jgi:hypothetical protein
LGMAQEERKGGRFGVGRTALLEVHRHLGPGADAVRIRRLPIASNDPQIPSALPPFRPSVQTQMRGFLSAGAAVVRRDDVTNPRGLKRINPLGLPVGLAPRAA